MVAEWKHRRQEFTRDGDEIEESPRRTILSTVWFRALLVVVALAVVGMVVISYLSDRWALTPRPAPSRAKIEVPPPPPSPRAAPAQQETIHAPLVPPPAKSEPAAQQARMEAKAPQKPKTEARAAGRERSRAEARVSGEYWIQVGAFKDQVNAARLAARLTSENYPIEQAAIERPTGDTHTIFLAGASLDEVSQKLRGREYRAESAGTEIAIKPSLPLKDAVALSKELAREGFAVKIRRASDAGTFHVVRVGGYPDRQRAEAVLKELGGKGFPGFLVTAEGQ